jgi:hypothetical protein
MKMTAKRHRSDSIAASLIAAKAVALGPLAPPAHVCLRPGDLPYWEAIMTARPRDTWTVIDLCTAGNLARTQADVERLQQELDSEGYTFEGKLNPLAKLVDTLSRRALALARALHVHAEATVGESRDASKAFANEKKAAAPASDLIPTLGPVYLVG